MKFLFRCLLSGLLLGGYAYSYAQSTTIQGNVSTASHLSGGSTTVILLSAADSAILKSTLCDSAGSFKFKNVDPGNYLLLVSKIGYNQSMTGPYTIAQNQIFTLRVTLIAAMPQLKEVTVAGKKPYIEVRPGKVVLNVQSSIIAEGNSAFDILRQAPGVQVDYQHNISIIGKQNALITIDGKPTNLTGENLTDFLQGLQSSTIQQIELITNPSAKYDASGAGIINIVTKKGTNVGANGTFTAGAGYGNFYKANAGLVFNNRTDKFNIFGNYNYSADKSYHTFMTDRFINYNGLLSDYNDNYYTTQQRFNHNFRLGTDYYLTDKQTLGVLVYGTVTNSNFSKTNYLKIANNGVMDSTISANSSLSRNLSNITYDLNYNGVLDKSGKTLSADVLYNNVVRHSAEYIANDFYTAAGSVYRQPLLLQNLSPSDIHNWVSKIDYVNPISANAKLEAGIKYSYVQSNNNLIFGPLVNGQYQSDPNFSNTFIFTENINSTYINYVGTVDKFNITAGLRAEQTNATGNSVTLVQTNKNSYLDFFPQLQLTYQYDKKNEFTLSYNRGIQRPSYSDINPFLYYSDLYDYRAGNPNLLPQYSNTIQLTHTYNKLFTTTAYAIITTDFDGFNDYQQNDSSKIDITTIKNFGTFSTYGLKFSAPVQFTSWWEASLLADVSYQRIKAYAVNGNLNKGTQDVQLSTVQSFTLSSTIAAEITGKYESPTFYGISQFKAQYSANAGISKQLFENKATVKLSVSDLFNTYRDRGYSTYQNLNLTIVDKSETRIVRASFVYHFGKITVKSVRHRIANEEEQNRASKNN